jgi:plastocyanin
MDRGILHFDGCREFQKRIVSRKGEIMFGFSSTRSAWMMSPLLLTAMMTMGARAEAAKPAIVVGMTNGLKFAPAAITITVGQTIEWRNTSNIAHTVTADPSKARKPGDVELPKGARPFASGTMKPGATFKHTFTVPGRYKYICKFHELQGMIGEVNVKPAE